MTTKEKLRKWLNEKTLSCPTCGKAKAVDNKEWVINQRERNAIDFFLETTR